VVFVDNAARLEGLAVADRISIVARRVVVFRIQRQYLA
jgi:hypothetical protein